MKIKLGDVLYIKGRIGWQSLKKDEYLEKGDYYLVTGININEHHKINYNDCCYVSKERYLLDEKIQLKNGDIILTKDGTIGKIAIIENLNKPATLNSHLFLLRNLKPEILNTKYLFYLLQSDRFMKYALSNTSGSNIPGFTQKDFIEFETELPELKVQEQIGELLSNIDKKVENNDNVIKKLESIATTIYNHYFLDFEFPHEKGSSYKSDNGDFIYNEKIASKLPAKWDAKKVSEILNVVTGKEDANFASKNGKYNFFTCGKEILKCETPKFEGSAILVAGNGDFNVKHYSGKFNAYQRTYVLIPENKKYYGQLYILCNYLIDKFKKGSNGSIVKFIKKGDLENIVLPVANDDKLYEKINECIFLAEEIAKENEKLITLRNKLLPMLFNGQITLKEVK